MSHICRDPFSAIVSLLHIDSWARPATRRIPMLICRQVGKLPLNDICACFLSWNFKATKCLVANLNPVLTCCRAARFAGHGELNVCSKCLPNLCFHPMSDCLHEKAMVKGPAAPLASEDPAIVVGSMRSVQSLRRALCV